MSVCFPAGVSFMQSTEDDSGCLNKAQSFAEHFFCEVLLFELFVPPRVAGQGPCHMVNTKHFAEVFILVWCIYTC